MQNEIDLMQIFSAFIVLLAIIDTLGAIPKILEIKREGKRLNSLQGASFTFVLMLGFFFGGQWVLTFFGVDAPSFAAAGSIVIFLTALEIILDITIFKEHTPLGKATLVPIVFPMLAGAGSFTTLLSLRAAYADINILIALLLNMVWVFVVMRWTDKVERLLGNSGLYFTRKFFGIILLAMSVKLFTENMGKLLN